MNVEPDRLVSIWRRTFSLGWPISVQQSLNTLMRTVDILVTGFFSPVSVAAIGLADLYSRLPLRIGMGLGSGAIALSSQETGRNTDHLRNRAITQALLVGALAGLPFVLVGLAFGDTLIALLGAEPDVVREGGRYLAIIFAAAPMRIAAFVGARSLQGTGDTRTPMYVNGASTILNILLTVTLGLGVWIAPTLEIVGVGVATAISRTVEATLIIWAIVNDRTAPGLARPRSLIITRQLFEVSVPDIAGGLSTEIARFPFNSLLLLFGTEVVAAYHVANRIYQQISAPLFRAFRTTSSILVGQELGAGRAADARFSAGAICALSVAVMTTLGAFLFLGAHPLATFFTRDVTTIGYAVGFNRAFAVSLVFIGVYFPFAGALKGAGDTRTPFWAGIVGSYVFLLGTSYLLAVIIGLDHFGVLIGIVLSYVSRAVIVGAGLAWGDWADLAARMIAERQDVDDDGEPAGR